MPKAEAVRQIGARPSWPFSYRLGSVFKDNRQGHLVAGNGRKGRLIRHTFLRDRAAPAKRPLTVSMIESALGTLLVTPVGKPMFLAIALITTGRAAVAVPAVTVTTNPEEHAAGATNTQT